MLPYVLKGHCRCDPVKDLEIRERNLDYLNGYDVITRVLLGRLADDSKGEDDRFKRVPGAKECREPLKAGKRAQNFYGSPPNSPCSPNDLLILDL